MKNHTVTVYSTTTCHFCVIAKDYLNEKKVSFVNKDVGVDIDARQEMIKKSGQMGVPVIEIDGQIVVGFDQDMIDNLLSK